MRNISKVTPDVNIFVGNHAENSELWLSEQRVMNLFKANMPHFEDASGVNVNMSLTVNNYHIQGNNQVLQAEYIDQSIHNTFNFHDCNIGLQGNLNHLAQLLKEAGHQEQATELENTAKALETLEQSQSEDEVKKNGIVNRLRGLLDDLGDDKSELGKTVKGVKKGVDIAQNIAKGYNDIAEWVGAPQVPNAFLKKGK